MNQPTQTEFHHYRPVALNRKHIDTHQINPFLIFYIFQWKNKLLKYLQRIWEYWEVPKKRKKNQLELKFVCMAKMKCVCRLKGVLLVVQEILDVQEHPKNSEHILNECQSCVCESVHVCLWVCMHWKPHPRPLSTLYDRKKNHFEFSIFVTLHQKKATTILGMHIPFYQFSSATRISSRTLDKGQRSRKSTCQKVSGAVFLVIKTHILYNNNYTILPHHSQDCHLGQLYQQDQSLPLYPEGNGVRKTFNISVLHYWYP